MLTLRRVISFLNISFSCLSNFSSLIVLSFFSGLLVIVLLVGLFVLLMFKILGLTIEESKSLESAAVEKLSLFPFVPFWLIDKFEEVDVECDCCLCVSAFEIDPSFEDGMTVDSLTCCRFGSRDCSASVKSNIHLSLRSSSLDAGKSFHYFI